MTLLESAPILRDPVFADDSDDAVEPDGAVEIYESEESEESDESDEPE